ncbi:hypothetical protein F5X96DRAFT_615790 [Biscogniauxia mediterranea]|nr:hypothetical protein F5X96DRAFT_615790 [Biscogniauxia mediterranea]
MGIKRRVRPFSFSFSLLFHFLLFFFFFYPARWRVRCVLLGVIWIRCRQSVTWLWAHMPNPPITLCYFFARIDLKVGMYTYIYLLAWCR